MCSVIQLCKGKKLTLKGLTDKGNKIMKNSPKDVSSILLARIEMLREKISDKEIDIARALQFAEALHQIEDLYIDISKGVNKDFIKKEAEVKEATGEDKERFELRLREFTGGYGYFGGKLLNFLLDLGGVFSILRIPRDNFEEEVISTIEGYNEFEYDFIDFLIESGHIYEIFKIAKDCGYDVKYYNKET